MKYIKLFEAKRNFTLIFDIITKLVNAYELVSHRSGNVMRIMEIEPLFKKWNQDILNISVTQSNFDLHISIAIIKSSMGKKIVSSDTKEFIEKLNTILKENIDEYRSFGMCVIKKENVQKYITALEENVDILIEEVKIKFDAKKYNL